MELLSNRNISEIIKKMLICVFALGGFVSADLAYSQSDLPRLSFGVNQSFINFSDVNDVNRGCWWSDNQIWTPPQRAGSATQPQQEILIPVFIENRWKNFTNVAGVVFQEISSFSFRVYYDERVLQFLDVQKHHPFDSAEAINLYSTHFYGPNMPYYQPLAKHFELVTANNKVDDYYKYFNINDETYNIGDDRIGSTVTVTGTASSFYNLETTNPNETKVLLYLKFKVLPVESAGGQTRTCPIYFDPTYIEYNGINITQNRGDKLLESMPFPDDPNYNNFRLMFRNWAAVRYTNDNMKYLDMTWLDTKKYAEVFQKSVGLWNSHYNYNSDKYNSNPYLPGSITVRVMTQFPKFRFQAVDYITNIPAPELTITQDGTDSSLWIMTEPITADVVHNGGNTAYNNKSERAILVSVDGDVPYNVMENIIVETDQPWLKIRTASRRTSLVNTVDKFLTAGQDRRRAFAQRANNLISTNNAHNPFSDNIDGNFTPGQFVIWVDCDQTLAMPTGDEVDTHGEYIGHVTFRSAFDKYEKTSIRVKFIVVANPVEKNTGLSVSSNVITPNGITLELTPFNGTRPDLTRKLIMGSSPYALDKADSLFGEFARQQPLGSDVNGQNVTFDARFLLDSNIYTLGEFIAKSTAHLINVTNDDTNRLTNEWNSLTRNGFGDYTHLDGLYNNNYDAEYRNARSHSRDIRSSLPSDKSNTHYVRYRFDDAGTDFYPVILRWDTRTFPGNNTIQLKYVNNGTLQTIDMKNGGTSIGNNMYTFAFTDKGVEEFWIEYTVGQTSNDDPLLDNFGDEIIQANSWNFVSLPLDPVNRHYKYTFPNCINNPYLFFLNAWAGTVNGELQPGYGYFVKYLNLVDKKFYGSYFDYLDTNNYKVRLYASAGAPGWNAIGALSKIVSTNAVSFTPYIDGSLADINNTRNNGFWAYQPKKGYKQVDRLHPGKGYFIKVDNESYLRIDGRAKSTFELPTAIPNKTTGFDQITLADANQNVANIYAANNVDQHDFEMPPLPPSDMFDVRFSQNNYAANYNNEHNLVKMQGVKYPVSINFNNPTANYTIMDPVTNEVYGTVKAGTNDNIIINSARGNVLKLVAEAAENALFVSVNNNPVNTNTAEVAFGINSNANVSIAIYNAIGNEVSKMNFGYLNAGIHSHNFNVNNLATGVYTVRMTADSQTRVFMMNVIK